MDNNKDDIFCEIEYSSFPVPGGGRAVMRTQKIEQPERDAVRDLFYRMRDISWNYSSFSNSKNRFYDKKVQRENAKIFYKQAVFMKDFEDQYEKVVPYSSYFSNYQMMGYEQLRTYFTWRTQVRKGEVNEVSLSYAFLYIYELLHNIGVESPQEGLEKLLSFWEAFRRYDTSVDKYLLRWLKDYFIYYEMPEPFREFVAKNDLMKYYPELEESDDKFRQYCSISKYDIRKSNFYTEERITFIQGCFNHTLSRISKVFEENDMSFEALVLEPSKKMTIWNPFQDALFYQWKNQPDREVVLSKKEVYICTENKWTCSSVITTESGKKLVGYVMKQMEVVLRRLMKYRFKLSADNMMVTQEAVQRLEQKGSSLERIVTDAVIEYYREATKTVVKVDPGRLSRIRQEAYITQEKLTVPEEDEWILTPLQPEKKVEREQTQIPSVLVQQKPVVEEVAVAGPWEELKNALTETELCALSMICMGSEESDIRKFADEQGMMLEVLMDGINEKAMDLVGDSLTDDEFTVYEDYIEEVRKMVEGI